MTNRYSSRPGRKHAAGWAGAFLAGVIVAAGLVPLLATDASQEVDANEVPAFLDRNGPGNGAGQVASPSRGEDSLSQPVTDTASDADPDQNSRSLGGALAPGGARESAPESQDHAEGSEPADGIAGVQRSDSDVGVTSEAIKVGVLSADCDACESIGFLASRNAGRMGKVFAEEINNRGGIHGRKLEVVVAEYDPVQDAISGTNTDREACVKLTEGAKVFAAVIPFANAATRTECYYGEHETATLAQAPNAEFRDPETFNKYNGRLFSVGPTSARTLVTWARDLVSGRYLDNRKFAIVMDDTTNAVTRDFLIKELNGLGYNPTHVAAMPADTASFQAKAQTEQAAMRRKGVDTVLFVINPVSSQTWIQQAESSGWRPKYHITDFPNIASDAFSSRQPSSFDGAISMSYIPPAGTPQSPADGRCIKIWEDAIGQPTDSVDLQTFTLHTVCNLFLMLEKGANRASVELTRESFANGLASIGPLPLAGVITGEGSLGGAYGFGSVKFSAVDHVLTKEWKGGRWVGVGAARRMPA